MAKLTQKQEAIYNLAIEGLLLKDIAKRLDVTPTQISKNVQWMARKGFPEIHEIVAENREKALLEWGRSLKKTIS